MKKSSFAKSMLAVGVVVACLFGLVACGGGNSKGSVAATVNGAEIYEQAVTDQIEQIRQQSGLDDTDQWGLFLAQNEMTPESVREQIIDTMVEQELIKQGAKELGVAIEKSEVDEYINQMKANYDGDDAWTKALEQAGFTEESYREIIESSLIEQKISDHFQEDAQVSNDDYITAAQTYAPYYDGAKRSSHILIAVEDTTNEAAVNEAKKQAEDIAAKINSGELSFEDAAKQFSGDTGSAEKGGDVGWDVTSSFASEYAEALDGLEKDQMSGPVVSQYGVHIIKVTDVFKAPEEITSMDQIPADFQDSIKEMASSIKANSSYTDWLTALKEKADIKINPMPKGLPYDVDMTKYQEQVEAEKSAEAATSTDGTTSTGEGTTSDTTAPSSSAESASSGSSGQANGAAGSATNGQ